MKSFVASLAVASAAPFIPTIPMCAPKTQWNPQQNCYPMPIVGEGSCCGTYNITSWLNAGGIHIDTSTDYGSQPDIGNAIRASGIPRANLWLTSKLNVESCGTNMTSDFFSQIMKPLGTGINYVDLLLLHHAGRHQKDTNPHPPCFDASLANTNGTYATCRLQTVQAFEDLRKQGLIRTWGVSNWQIRELQQVYDVYGFYPPINQIEISPIFRSAEVISFCNRHGILTEAYAPFGDGTRSNIVSDPHFPPIAAAHKATVGQIILAWELAIGADIVIPRSSQSKHQIENLNLFTPAITLNETEIAIMGSVKPMAKVYDTECQPWC